ncbi:MAG TPA: hypothetical protein VNW04_13320 [Puia sp.]|nr:hypothetical protein [Puia sp.]
MFYSANCLLSLTLQSFDTQGEDIVSFEMKEKATIAARLLNFLTQSAGFR